MDAVVVVCQKIMHARMHASAVVRFVFCWYFAREIKAENRCAPYMFAKDVAKTISAKINCAHSFAKYFAKKYLRKIFYEKIRADHFCEHCFRKIFCAKRKTAVKMEKAGNR